MRFRTPSQIVVGVEDGLEDGNSVDGHSSYCSTELK